MKPDRRRTTAMGLHPRHAELLRQMRLQPIIELGNGGFGVVWRVQREDDGTFWAVKLLDRKSKAGKIESRSIPHLQRLQHPNLVRVEAVEQTPDCLAIVMELADRTLWQRFEEARRLRLPGLPAAELLDYLEGV